MRGGKERKKEKKGIRAHGRASRSSLLILLGHSASSLAFFWRIYFIDCRVTISVMPQRCSNCVRTGAKGFEIGPDDEGRKKMIRLSLSLSALSLSLPGGCLSQSLSHLHGARLRSSLSWRGSLRRDRAAAAAAEGGAGAGAEGNSLIFAAAANKSSSRENEKWTTLLLRTKIRAPFSPNLLASPLLFLLQPQMTSVAMRARASAVTSHRAR